MRQEQINAALRGQHVVVCANICYFPYTAVPAGETGTVVDVYEDIGAVEVRLHKVHAGLAAWNNCILLDDTGIANIEPLPVTTPTLLRRIAACLMVWGMMWAVCAAALVWP